MSSAVAITSKNGERGIQASKKILKCAICSKTYLSRQGRAYHMKSHTNEKPYKCEPCEKFYKTRGLLVTHNQYKHSTEKPYSCPDCPANFTTRVNLTRHTAVHDPSTKRECNICHKILAISSFPSHMKMHSKVMNFSCIMCDKSFYMQDHLKLHITRKHLMERPYSCKKCPATFPVRFLRTHHILRVHKPEEWFTKECALCSKKFHSQFEQNSHMTIHTGEKHYKCSTCGKRFRSGDVLLFHCQAMHDGGRKLIKFCIMCDKGFPNNGALSDHLFVHTREKPFWCKTCPASFYKKNKLEKHIRESKAHNEGGENRLSMFCIICDKGFANIKGLRQHLYVHTKEKPFWCEQCPSSYNRRNELEKHIRKTHENNGSLLE